MQAPPPSSARSLVALLTPAVRFLSLKSATNQSSRLKNLVKSPNNRVQPPDCVSLQKFMKNRQELKQEAAQNRFTRGGRHSSDLM